MRRIVFAVFLILVLPTAAFAARAPVPGDTCGGGGVNANGFPNGVTNAWTMTGPAADGGLVNGMFCNGSTWTGVINFQSSGNVGIGTVSPSSQLEIYNSAYNLIGPVLTLNNPAGGNGAGGGLQFKGYNGTDHADINTFDSGGGWSDLVFQTHGGSERLRITQGGNVGIGTTSPAAKLDVAGEIRTTGNSLACSSTTAGAIRYNSSSKAFDYCGGATPAWTAFGGGSAAGTTGQVQFNSGGALAGASGLVYASSTGNVGIGTASPSALLQVNGASAGTTQALILSNGNNGLAADEGVYQSFTISSGGNEMGRILAGNKFASGAAHGYLAFYTRSNDNLLERVRIDNTGYLGIGTTSPAAMLDVAGDIHYSGALTDVSDRRLKHDIRPLPGQLALLERLQPVSYVKNADPKFRTDFGFIAQDVQPIYPDLVETDPTGLRSMNYTGLISPIVAGMQEQQDEIRALWAALIVMALIVCGEGFLLWRMRPRR